MISFSSISDSHRIVCVVYNIYKIDNLAVHLTIGLVLFYFRFDELCFLFRIWYQHFMPIFIHILMGILE